MTRTRDPQELRRRRDEIRDELARVGDLRPGSLVGRFRRCGKPNCRCAREGEEGHGPSWSLTRAVDGRTVTRIIPADAVERTRKQIAEHRRFRALAGELVEVSEELCDALLAGTGGSAEAERGGSARPSARRSPPR